jgi:hypothetical protein
MFSAFPVGTWRPAAAFAVLVLSLSSIVGATIEHLFAARHWAATSSAGLSSAFFTSLALDFTTSVLLVGLGSLIFHGVALLLGGDAPYVTALRACCYVAAVDLLDMVGVAANSLLVSGSTLVLGVVAVFFVTWALLLIAQQRYGLARARALTAALSPIVVAALLAAGLVAAVARFLPD